MQSLTDLFAERAPSLGSELGPALVREGQRHMHGITGVAERLLLSSLVPPGVILSDAAR